MAKLLLLILEISPPYILFWGSLGLLCLVIFIIGIVALLNIWLGIQPKSLGQWFVHPFCDLIKCSCKLVVVV